jgi:hypothetical protein
LHHASARGRIKILEAATHDFLDADILRIEHELKPLLAIRNEMVEKLTRTREIFSNKQKYLRTLRSLASKSADSLETKLFKVLKGIGVELSSYHGGSLHGKDIKTEMNNATYVFSKFSSILKLGKWDNCELGDEDIDTFCQHFQSVFVLWDGAFSFARKFNPTTEDVRMYQQFIETAVKGHVKLGLSITPKVHLMFKHVRWQMENIPGGLGDKMEDWMEKQHQEGKQL